MKRPPTELAERLRGLADHVLALDGATSVDELATAAGVARTTLYYYFTGRDDLVDFLLIDKIERMAAGMAGEGESDGDEVSRLEESLTGMVYTIAKDPALCTKLMSRLTLMSETQELAMAVDRAILQPLRQLLRDGRESGAFEVNDVDLTAHALYGAVSMAALSRYARSGRIDAAATAGALVPQLIAAVRSPPQPGSRRSSRTRTA